MSSNNIYYVYAYLRSKDSKTAKAGTPYYIGKGKGRRAYGKHTFRIPSDSRLIVILETGLTETGALSIERRLIAWWGRKDLNTGILRNQTDGGDGASGTKRSVETRNKISRSRAGQPMSNEARQRMSESHKGRTLSEDTKTKISKGRKGKGSFSGSQNGMFGKHHSEQVKHDQSLRAKGNKSRLGKPHLESSKEKQAEKARNRQTYACCHCGMVCVKSLLNRWHNDNCKSKPK